METPFRKYKKSEIYSCVVNGKYLTATVIGEYDLPIQYGFEVSFSDGYRGTFISTDFGWWVDGRKDGKPYADAISDDLTRHIGKKIE